MFSFPISKKINQKKIWAPFFLITSLGLVLFFHEIGWLERFENLSLDFRFNYYPPENSFSDKIVIVDIDEISLQTYANTPLFGRWPWNRKVYPPILEYIHQSGAKIILFDLLFIEETEDDADLIRATLGLGNVSHAISVRKENLTPQEIIFYKEIVPQNIKKIKLNVSGLENINLKIYNTMSIPSASIQVGSNKLKLSEVAPYFHVVSYEEDFDGIARKAQPFFLFYDSLYPSLSLLGLMNYYEIERMEISKDQYLQIYTKNQIGVVRIPLTKEGKYQLNYYKKEIIDNLNRVSISGVIDTIRSLRAGEILNPSQGKVPPEIFQDKIVIIGASAESAYDIRLTPFGNRPGYIYHAVFLSNLLENHFLQSLDGDLFHVILIFLIGIALYFLLYKENIFLKLFVPLFILILYIFLSLFLFRWSIWLPIGKFFVGYGSSLLMGVTYFIITENKEKRKFHKVLSNLVDPTIVTEALRDLESLKKGREMEITAFFSDIAGFSSISEKLSATELARLINEYLSHMTIILKNHKGTLDKYIGDAIVGIFGAPVELESHCKNAAETSLEMLKKLEEIKEKWKNKKEYIPEAWEMGIRIGLNSGIAKVGFMGTESLASYTMMGDTVNLASRLESAAKDYGVSILISESTRVGLGESFFCRKLDLIRVKGKSQPVWIYELIDSTSQISDKQKNACELYEKGFNFYMQRDWNKAVAYFQKSQEKKETQDLASELLILRCEFYKKNPPPEEWDGVFTRTHK